MVKLGDVFQIGSGGTPSKSHPEYYGGDIPWVKTGDLGKQYIYGVDECITEEGLKNSSAKMYEPDTVLVAMYGATIGATSILKIYACTNQACAAFRPIDSIIPEYLYYFLISKKDKFIHDGVGGAQPNISATYLKSVPFTMLPLESQRSIVNRLNTACAIIANRQQQLQALDILTKARFVEMFGDPVANSSGWNQTILREITTKIGSGATPRGGKESYQSEGISLIRSMNVHDGRFEYKDLAHITDEQAGQLENVAVRARDVFINITGASVARSCIVPDDVLPARVNQHVAIIRCKQEYLHPVFANNLFLNDRFKGILLDIGESGGATRQAITKQQLEALEVILPPIELQKKFAAFVSRVDKSKVVVQEALNKAQLLFDSLMQKYFG